MPLRLEDLAQFVFVRRLVNAALQRQSFIVAALLPENWTIRG
jgi:hypothetical protein